MTVGDILERVTTLYNDLDYDRVSKVRYLQFLDDAINQLILSRPDAHVRTNVVKLVPGSRQSLPEDGYSLIDIYYNKLTDDDGETFTTGSPVFLVQRKDLDYFSNWHTAGTATNEIEEFAYDSKTPKTFWVSPPPTNSNDVYVEMDYSYAVAEYAKVDDTFENVLEMVIPLENVFKGPLVSYMLYLLYSTDSSAINDMTVAQRYEQSFYQALGIEYKASLLVRPKINPRTDEEQLNG